MVIDYFREEKWIMIKVYDYTKNVLAFTRKDATKYHIELRGKITIIDGNSGTGKSLLVTELYHLKESGKQLTGVNTDNIVFITSNQDSIVDDKILYILDRADMFLDDEMCNKICDCSNARFLIFVRGSYNLGVSPNHFGRFEKNFDTISVVYDFNEKWW